MAKVTVKIDNETWKILRQIAKELGLKTEQLIQQTLDCDLENIAVWMQRFDMTFSRKIDKQDTTKKDQLHCPDCAEPLEIKKNQLQCSNVKCDVIAVRSNGRIVRSSVPTVPVFKSF